VFQKWVVSLNCRDGVALLGDAVPPNRHGQAYRQPRKIGLVVQHGRSHGAPQAQCNGCGCREALRYGTADDGWDADRANFEIAVRTLAEGNALCATARIVQVDEDAAGGVTGC